MIGFWLVVGVMASALITVVVGTDTLAEWQWTQGIGGMLIMLAISLPLYVCATASVPIAAALVAAGLPGGAALVFLMAGPASNVATIGAVYRAFGRPITIVYLGTVTVGSIVLGLLFDQFWGVTVSAHAGEAHDHAHGWIAVVSGIILAMLLLRHLWHRLGAQMRARRHSDAAELHLVVSGMSCGGCASKLQRAVSQLPGVSSVTANAASGSVHVVGSADRDAIAQAIADAGFSVQD
jgi:copper chaperone CopZ